MSNDTINDRPSRVRPGEELPLEQLTTYLDEKLGINSSIEVSQFPSGYSNLTYFIKCGDEEFVLRRPPHGANIKSAHDMSREYNVLSLLRPHFPHVPRALLYEEDTEIIGAPFYLMERVQGVILRNRAPKGMHLTAEMMREISAASIQKLAELHQVDVNTTGLVTFGKPEGYIKRQVEGWASRYENAATDNVPGMTDAAKWLQDNQLTAEATAFIHNDFKYDNLVLDSRKVSDVVAVLDWEMATVGDPLMDLGTTLGYWCEAGDSDALKPFNLTWTPGNLTREQVVERYSQLTGLDTRNILFYYVFGVFKIGVIVQQIYARYKKGLTKDPRFSQLIHVVRACGANAYSAIQHNRISNLV